MTVLWHVRSWVIDELQGLQRQSRRGRNDEEKLGELEGVQTFYLAHPAEEKFRTHWQSIIEDRDIPSRGGSRQQATVFRLCAMQS